jgi:hypothetical protein
MESENALAAIAPIIAMTIRNMTLRNMTLRKQRIKKDGFGGREVLDRGPARSSKKSCLVPSGPEPDGCN